MVNFGLLAAEIGSVQPLSRLAFVNAGTSLTGGQPNFARCLAISWAGWYSIYTFLGALAPKGILPAAKFTLRPSLVLSYISNVTTRHSSSGRQPNIAALSRGNHLYSAGRPSRWALAHILVVSTFKVNRHVHLFIGLYSTERFLGDHL